MNAHTTITPLETLKAQLRHMNDRDKLMLIDWIADQLDDELGDELAEGLAVAFERAEEGVSGIWSPLYPATGNWKEWRLERDRSLNAHFYRVPA